MLKKFDEIVDYVREKGTKKRIAIAGPQDVDVLECAIQARKIGLAEFVLVGNSKKIIETLEKLQQNPVDWEIVNGENDFMAADIVAKMIVSNEADLPMKGLLHTSVFLKSILNKELNLVNKNALLSQVTVLEYEKENRLMLITDCAINIAPTYEEKMKIVQNAVNFCHKLGIEEPKVAVIAPVEEVKLSIPSTLDAALLSKSAERRQLSGCIVDGPLGLDNALSKEAAKQKGIRSSVAGNADVLLMPDLAAGNILDKSLRYFASYKTAGCVLGAKVPLIMTSRSDSPENKLNAIACSLLQIT